MGADHRRRRRCQCSRRQIRSIASRMQNTTYKLLGEQATAERTAAPRAPQHSGSLPSCAMSPSSTASYTCGPSASLPPSSPLSPAAAPQSPHRRRPGKMVAPEFVSWPGRPLLCSGLVHWPADRSRRITFCGGYDTASGGGRDYEMSRAVPLMVVTSCMRLWRQ